MGFLPDIKDTSHISFEILIKMVLILQRVKLNKQIRTIHKK